MGVRIPGQATSFCFLQNVQTVFGAHQAGIGGVLCVGQCLMGLWPEADHSPETSNRKELVELYLHYPYT